VFYGERHGGCGGDGCAGMTDLSMQTPHRRFNALTGDWVTVSPQRAERPWQGEAAPKQSETTAAHDPGCYLCPGNTRVNGQQNPDYQSPWAFDNDFPAVVGPSQGSAAGMGSGDLPPPDELFRSEVLTGSCRVLCYSPDHSKTLSQLTEGEIQQVIALWKDEVAILRRRHEWVQVFENKGAMMGCSNPHPHGQIWAVDTLPNEARRESAQQAAWFAENGETLLESYRKREEAIGERVVAANSHWYAVVPYWAVWPFETLLMPRRRVDHLDALDSKEQRGLATLLKQLLSGYDRLFATPCPYTMGWHGAPGPGVRPDWQLHAHVYPPLLRSATVRKHMVGYEMLSEAQRDLTPEAAAEQLRGAIGA